VRAEKQRELLA